MKNWWFQEISTVTFFFGFSGQWIGTSVPGSHRSLVTSHDLFGAPNFGSFQKGKWTPFVSGRFPWVSGEILLHLAIDILYI